MKISVAILTEAGKRYAKEQMEKANESLSENPVDWDSASMFLGDASAGIIVIDKSLEAAVDGFVESSVVNELLWGKMDTAPRDELREIIIITIPEPVNAA
jgi:hypothetical protein